MKAWVEKPAARGARRHRRLRRAVRRQRAETYDKPLLATSTDGVGTKVAIAQAMDIHDTIGFDLVGMVVDDLVVCGAEPLFITDYIASGRVVPERIAAIVKGIAEACVDAGCALIGGETAEHPGCWSPTSTTSPARRPASSRPTSCSAPNGSARATSSSRWRRAACTPTATRWSATSCSDGAAGRSTATSTSSAAPSARSCSSRPASTPRPASPWPSDTELHAMSHVTGGGLAANLARVLPDGLTAAIDRAPGRPRRSSTWCARSARCPSTTSRGRSTGRRHGRPRRRRRRRTEAVGARRARRLRLGRRRGHARRRSPPRWDGGIGGSASPAGDFADVSHPPSLRSGACRHSSISRLHLVVLASSHAERREISDHCVPEQPGTR